MRILFAGTPSAALPRDVARLGHEVLFPAETDWWAAMQAGVPPDRYADALWAACKAARPDALVVHKGWHWWHERERWAVPAEVLWGLRKLVPAILYLCADDPAATPVTIALGLPAPCDVWLTTCPGIVDAPLHAGRYCARIEEFWLAWDEDVRPQVDPELAGVQVALTGHPYYRPFPAPHYQLGFATVRRDLVRRAIECGLRPGIWGPSTWTEESQGGDPKLAAWYRGWLDPSQIHVVHGSVGACVGTHLVEGRRYESGRCVWTLGAGGVLVHELRPGLADEFGDAALWFRPGDIEGALSLCERLSADHELSARMRAEGRALVLERHTWVHRAARLVELAEEARRPAPYH